MRSSSTGFTLIELLIVVAIIAILAAIAIPNFIEAQVRAKVSRGLADMRSIAVGLESYRVDGNHYPPSAGVRKSDGSVVYPLEDPRGPLHHNVFVGPGLTTPVAYMSSIPTDLFAADGLTAERRYYFFRNYTEARAWYDKTGGTFPAMMEHHNEVFGRWFLLGSGPDRDRLDIAADMGRQPLNGFYDATNGSVSNGDIIRSPRVGASGR